MVGQEVKLTDANAKTVLAKGVALVDFWATWCGPCMMQGPIVSKVAEKIGAKAIVAKLDVDENPQTAAEYEVTAIPTLILFKDGKEVERFVGMRQEAVLIAAIEKQLA